MATKQKGPSGPIVGPSGMCMGYDRSITATQETPVATAPSHPPTGRLTEEERRSG